MSLVRKSNQKVFFDIYTTQSDFTDDLSNNYSFFKPDDMTDDYITKTYWLLAARFGDQAISGYTDEGRWKLRLFQCLNQYGPVWEKKSELQKQIRALTLDQLKETGKVINNSALNPNNEPTTEELNFISAQSTSKSTMSNIDALNLQYVALDDDLDKVYTDHFKPLFSKFLLPDSPLYLYKDTEVD